MISIFSHKQKNKFQNHSSSSNNLKGLIDNHIIKPNCKKATEPFNGLSQMKKILPLKIPCYINNPHIKERFSIIRKRSPKSKVNDYIKHQHHSFNGIYYNNQIRKVLSCFNLSIKDYKPKSNNIQLLDEQRDINKKIILKLPTKLLSRNISFYKAANSERENMTYSANHANYSIDISKSTKDNSKVHEKLCKCSATNTTLGLHNLYYCKKEKNIREDNKEITIDMETPESLHFAFVALMQKKKQISFKYDNIENEEENYE